MANTYTQLHIQIIIAVKYQRALIQKSWKTDLYKYITGIVQKSGHKMLAINGVEDHLHMLIGWRPNQSLSALMQQVKRSSTIWINVHKLTHIEFKWQAGFSAFSYSKSAVRNVTRYIERQEEHHAKKSMKKEQTEMLKKAEIKYDEKYLFKDPE